MTNYDLEAAFEYNPNQPIKLEDIDSIKFHWTDGEDEPSFCWILALNNGKYAVASGWHDYTGWDCQSGFQVSVYDTIEEAWRLGLTDEHRSGIRLMLGKS